MTDQPNAQDREKADRVAAEEEAAEAEKLAAEQEAAAGEKLAAEQEAGEARVALEASVGLLILQLQRLDRASTTWRSRLEARGAQIAEMLDMLRKLHPKIPDLTPSELSKERRTVEDAAVCYQGMVSESRFGGWTLSVVVPALVASVFGLAVLMVYNYTQLQSSGTLYTVVYCVCGGGLGGAAGALMDIFYYSGRRLYDPAWGQSYVVRPLLGATMGVAVYALLRAGLVVASQGGNAAPTNAAYFALAFVAGYAVEQMGRKLYDIAATAFAASDRLKRGS